MNFTRNAEQDKISFENKLKGWAVKYTGISTAFDMHKLEAETAK